MVVCQVRNSQLEQEYGNYEQEITYINCNLFGERFKIIVDRPNISQPFDAYKAQLLDPTLQLGTIQVKLIGNAYAFIPVGLRTLFEIMMEMMEELCYFHFQVLTFECWGKCDISMNRRFTLTMDSVQEITTVGLLHEKVIVINALLKMYGQIMYKTMVAVDMGGVVNGTVLCFYFSTKKPS